MEKNSQNNAMDQSAIMPEPTIADREFGLRHPVSQEEIDYLGSFGLPIQAVRALVDEANAGRGNQFDRGLFIRALAFDMQLLPRGDHGSLIGYLNQHPALLREALQRDEGDKSEIDEQETVDLRIRCQHAAAFLYAMGGWHAIAGDAGKHDSVISRGMRIEGDAFEMHTPSLTRNVETVSGKQFRLLPDLNYYRDSGVTHSMALVTARGPSQVQATNLMIADMLDEVIARAQLAQRRLGTEAAAF